MGFGQGTAIMHAEGDSFLMERCAACSFFLLLQGWPCVAQTGPVIGWKGLTMANSCCCGPAWPLPSALISCGASYSLYLVSRPEMLKNFFQASLSLLLSLLWAQGLHE